LGEGIPDLDDLRPILQQMEQAFSEGTRSVAVSLVLAGKHIEKLYHLSKVGTFHYLNGQSQITFLALPFQSLKQQQKCSSFGTRIGLSSELQPPSFSGHFGCLF
jgi:hypothetical protein